MKKVLVYHPFGNQNVRNILNGLLNNAMLHSFHTSIAIFPNTNVCYWLSKFGFKRFSRREYNIKIKSNTYCYPWQELIRQSNILSKIGLKNISSGKINMLLDKKVSKYIDKQYNSIYGVYCYTHGALNIFRSCKKHNIKCFYELPIVYYKELLHIIECEKIKNSNWATDIKIYQHPETLHIIDEELQLANHIFVASSYIKNSLVKYGFDTNKIHIIPYGFPKVSQKKYRTITNKLKLLYVGGLYQLKGLSYMFEAIEELSDQVELTIIGSGGESSKILSESLKKHRYLGSLSHQEVLKQMQECDILLFPSLSDGFGMVVSEAMSQGTPVIASDHCCAIDIIHDGINGWIVRSRSSEDIKNRLKCILNNPEDIERIGKNALETATKRPWESYHKEIIEYICKL